MSKETAGPISLDASAPSSEKVASSPAATRTPSTAQVSVSRLRSCIVCRKRKVRCDKQLPCSNCQRANIACVFPSIERPPRWARRLERLTNNITASKAPSPQDSDSAVYKVMDRLRNLEHLVKELSNKLEHAHAAASSTGGGSSDVQSPEGSSQYRDTEHQQDFSNTSDTHSVHKKFGRLVLQDAGHSHYVSSGFWSRVNDEIDGLKMDTYDLEGDGSDSSEDATSPGKTSSNQELERTPSDRHAFLFRHNLSPVTPNLREFHPLPSQIPFLLDVFSENVNFFLRTVHIPTVTKMMRDLRGNSMTRMTPSNEALMFSIYYAAITSLEEDDVMTNFGTSKTDLSFKYRLGLEHTLAKADFLNRPDLTLAQAVSIFLLLARRHDSPRFVWMMVGLVVRMAQYLGLQRDGSHFEHLTPFETHMQRKIWWCLRHQNPSNINDADINPASEQMPPEQHGLTDSTFPRIQVGVVEITRQLMAPGLGHSVAGLDDKSRLLGQVYQKFEQEFFQYTTESANISYWVGVTVARLVMAKLTLIFFLPVLFSSPSQELSDEIRTKLLVSAIEVAEYNHTLNAEQACRQWRWVFQVHTHWYAIVYLMLEISRRPWSPIVERAWVALHSSWLFPGGAPVDNNFRIWVPLRKLMDKAGEHRDAELNRLRSDPQATARLDMEDEKAPVPSSSGPFPEGVQR